MPEEVEREKFDVDFDDLTIGEIEEIEELTGVSIKMIDDPERPMGATLRVLAYIRKRRDNPDFTLEMAGDLLLVLDKGADEGKAETATDA